MISNDNRIHVVLCVLLLLAMHGGARVGGGESQPADMPIKRIYLIHFSHTDIGFTEMPGVCRELHRRYIDIALDKVLQTMSGPAERKFYWTCETLLPVADWWDVASAERRGDFLAALGSGQLEVAALPVNQTPFLNAAQWQVMMHWVPDELWQQWKPTVALQSDVNGFPRAGAIALLDRGVTRLCWSMNGSDALGGPPLPRYSAFWWKMPDGRRLFVYLNHSYPEGYYFFESEGWRRGPLPTASDTRYRPPRGGDFFRTDGESLRRAHAQCLRRLEGLRQTGYAHDVLVLSVTNEWRMDNDPPCLMLPEFVAAWNRLGLKPELVHTTASKALEALESSVGATAPEHAGEFPDWWANGTASAPREVAASRAAKRVLAAAHSPVWGPMPTSGQRTVHALYQDLCLFDEHTWGSGSSVALPWSLDTQAQWAEKAMLAWRPMGQAEWLLSQRARTLLLPKGEGLFVANPTRQPMSGWVRLPASCLRADYRSVLNPATSARQPLLLEPGMRPWTEPRDPAELTRENTAQQFPDNVPNQTAKFWVDALPGDSFVRLRLDEGLAAPPPPPATEPEVQVDPLGWPVSARWPGMTAPLFAEGLGDFIATRITGFAPRWALDPISLAGGSPRGDQLRAERIETTRATPEAATTVEDTAHTRVYEQWLAHPRLAWAKRRIELWKAEPRARVTLRFDRLSSTAPEIFYAEFPLPCENTLPRLSCGGVPFTPFQDQIPNTCADYLALDAWADYATPAGHWLWVSRDAVMVSLDQPQVWTRLKQPPQRPDRLLAMLFNNYWFTNFVADEHGVMEFQFELVWREKLDAPAAAELADTLVADPVVLINSGGRDDPIVLQRLFTP